MNFFSSTKAQISWCEKISMSYYILKKPLQTLFYLPTQSLKIFLHNSVRILDHHPLMYLNVNSIEKHDIGGESRFEGRNLSNKEQAENHSGDIFFPRFHLSYIYNNKIINILSQWKQIKLLYCAQWCEYKKISARGGMRKAKCPFMALNGYVCDVKCGPEVYQMP